MNALNSPDPRSSGHDACIVQTQIPSAANGGMSFPCLLIFPVSCPLAEAGVMVVLHGRGRDDEPLTHKSLLERYPYVTRLAPAAEMTGNVICIPLLGSFAHLDSPVRPEIRRATFLGGELPGWLCAEHGLTPDRMRWSLVGFSMGGTAAINLLARYPDVYATASNFGGNCDPAFYPKVLKQRSPAENVLGPYEEFPARYVEWANDHALDLLAGRADFAISLGCGQADPRLPMVRAQRDRLAAEGRLHTYAEYPGGHLYDFEHLLMQLTTLMALRQALQNPSASSAPSAS